MAIKKSELYSTLWSGCDTLRGSMDASQYKDYVLTLLFIKYISDKYHGDPNALVIVPDRSSFDYLKSLKGKPDIGDQINKSISALAEENGLIGVIDLTDFNDDTKLGKGKSMVNRLSDLIGVFENENLDFSGKDWNKEIRGSEQKFCTEKEVEEGKEDFNQAVLNRVIVSCSWS